MELYVYPRHQHKFHSYAIVIHLPNISQCLIRFSFPFFLPQWWTRLILSIWLASLSTLHRHYRLDLLFLRPLLHGKLIRLPHWVTKAEASLIILTLILLYSGGRELSSAEGINLLCRQWWQTSLGSTASSFSDLISKPVSIHRLYSLLDSSWWGGCDRYANWREERGTGWRRQSS